MELWGLVGREENHETLVSNWLTRVKLTLYKDYEAGVSIITPFEITLKINLAIFLQQ